MSIPKSVSLLRRGSMSVAFFLFENFRGVLAANRFKILQVWVLEPLGEFAFLVSS